MRGDGDADGGEAGVFQEVAGGFVDDLMAPVLKPAGEIDAPRKAGIAFFGDRGGGETAGKQQHSGYDSHGRSQYSERRMRGFRYR